MGRTSGVSISPYFDCTRHNLCREWLKRKDLRANGHVLEWIRHGVAVPWLSGGPLPRSIRLFRAADCPETKQLFYRKR